MSTNTQRKSNIELLRILTMCGVIALHYNNASIGGAFTYADVVKGNCLLMLVHMLSSIASIYLISYLIYKIYDVTIGKLFNLISGKITILNKDIYANCFEKNN